MRKLSCYLALVFSDYLIFFLKKKKVDIIIS